MTSNDQARDASHDDCVELGIVVGAHGIRGEITIKAHHLASSLWDKPRVFLFEQAGKRSERRMTMSRAPKGLIGRVEGIDSRDASEAFKGTRVLIARSAFPALPDDEYYLVDLIGMKVVEGERELGLVIGLNDYPTVSCVTVKSGEGSRELPLRKPFLVDVDLAQKKISCQYWDDLPVVPDED